MWSAKTNAAAPLIELRRRSIGYVEVWTRDDAAARRWYESHGFRAGTLYLHVCLDGAAETKDAIVSNVPRTVVCQALAHYLGSEPELIRRRFRRVHKCRLYRRPA